MGVSFKVSRIGKRFQPKPVLSETAEEEEVLADADVPQEGGRGPGKIESATSTAKKIEADATREDEAAAISENEVSFILNVFPDGYSIGKPSEAALQDIPKFLHPYDRASESLFSAIESGRMPGDILDDIPCKYVNGTIVCEVRDYRKCTSEAGPTVSSLDGSPIVNKIVLRMSLENIVKDLPLISDSTWTYGDLMEVESRILKALQPRLYLDPTPNLDRLCEDPVPTKLNLDLCSLRRKRRRQLQEFSVTNSNSNQVKKVCTDRVPESSNCRLGDAGPLPGHVMPQHVHENLTAQNVSSSHVLQQRGPVSDAPGAPPSGQDMMVTYTDNMNSNIASHNTRENQDGLMSPLLNKRPRLTSAGPDSNQQQLMGPHMDSLHGTDPHWKNPLLQHQSIGRGLQYGSAGVAKYPQQIVEGSLNQEVGATQFTMAQQRMGYTKEEPVDSERLDKQEFNQNRNEMHIAEAERNHIALHQSRPQQRLPQHAFVRSNFSQSTWNGLGQPLENNSRKEDQFSKRKSVQSPRVSAGGLPQSPLSSKSGEFSSGSVGHQFGPVSALGSSQKEKSAGTSLPAVGGTTSLTSSANDSMQRQHQTQLPAKRRSNSLPKTPVMSGVGSPASVSNMSVPLNASSSPVGTPPLLDPMMLDRFSKLERVAARHKIHFRKSKVNEQPIRKPTTFPSQQLSILLSSDSNNDNLRDESCTMPLSKSLVGGSMNACKIRVLNFVQTERMLQGNAFPIVPRARTRMIMSVKPNDGTIAMHFGDIDDGDFLAAEEYLPTLPNAHIADLLATQLCSLMIGAGYHVEDRTQPKTIRINRTSSNQSNAPGTSQNSTGVEMQQYSDAISGQPSNEFAKPTNSGSGSLTPAQNLPSTRMLPPGNAQALQNSQGLIPGVSVPARPQQSDPQTLLQPQPQPQPQQQQQQAQQALMQQQPSQFQRSSPLMLQTNPLSHMNTLGQNSSLPLGMVNKSTLQFQLLQQQQQQPQQQQQQQQLQRRMMMGLGTAVSLGNMGNSIMGFRGLNNVMGMGSPRGMGGAAISAPMGPISGMGTVSQNPMNLGQASSTIGQQLRSGTLTQAQAQALSKMRMGQNRSNLLGGPQSSMGGIVGARQMHPGSTSLSMFDHSLTRDISPLQRTPIGPMGPPKLMTRMNLYMNPQQQQQQQLQQQLQQQFQQQQPPQQFQQQQHPPQFQQPQQQETASPLQTVVSPQQVGSPSTLGIPQQVNQQSQQLQQQASPQQMSQRTPMSPQMSSGAMHPLSAGNPEACPASPQLSSQTLGSVGSITNSPMELQGVNKSNSVNNA
ncbi:protein PHYTOCHROME-DEPENDENT LATE-FLOWERING isoform X2 [Diospyros lotus]|uniref:protein PHYTOCHROME-DEPENDENT LATE-FLOWERING isoform X2 n=1 Tax=Diospyros lotus TaxID=55363 RepID=UPI0022524CBB|nr:protein PHYTOCHROME-DEPENDENT LATE-FLOWERING isoform X2 [Diospyros lotus]